MTKKRSKHRGGEVARNRVTNFRLWDDEGREWSREHPDIDASEVERLLKEASPKVGVQEDYGAALRWITVDEARRFWRDVILKSRASKKESLWAVAKWTSSNDVLLLFWND